jgi:hypothetical protein
MHPVNTFSKTDPAPMCQITGAPYGPTSGCSHPVPLAGGNYFLEISDTSTRRNSRGPISRQQYSDNIGIFLVMWSSPLYEIIKLRARLSFGDTPLRTVFTVDDNAERLKSLTNLDNTWVEPKPPRRSRLQSGNDY